MPIVTDFDMSHEEYYVPVKGLSPCKKDMYSGTVASAKDTRDATSSSIMDSLYANDVKMDALRDEKNHQQDLDVLMELYDVDCKVDRKNNVGHGCTVDDHVRDLWMMDKLVDGMDMKSHDDFVDPICQKIMMQMQVQAHTNLCINDTSGIVNLLRTDMFVDGTKADQEMNALSSLLEVDMEMDRASRSHAYRLGVENTKCMHDMDVTVDSSFRSLLETDQLVDGRVETLEVRDPYLPLRQEQRRDLVGSLFDVSDLLRTDLEVDGRHSLKHTVSGQTRNVCLAGISRSVQADEEVVGTKQDHLQCLEVSDIAEGEDLIVGIFGGLPGKPFSSASPVKAVDTPSKGNSFIGQLLGLNMSVSHEDLSDDVPDEKMKRSKGSFLASLGLKDIPSMFKKKM